MHVCSTFYSQYVVKYYGSYFKNTDLWIVMEYCGAGSVSDIMRIINQPVSHPYHTCADNYDSYTFPLVEGRGNSCCLTICTEGAGVPPFQEKNPQRYQSRQYLVKPGGTCQTGRLWGCWAIDGEYAWVWADGWSFLIWHVMVTGYNGQEKYSNRDTFLDGT